MESPWNDLDLLFSTGSWKASCSLGRSEQSSESKRKVSQRPASRIASSRLRQVLMILSGRERNHWASASVISLAV